MINTNRISNQSIVAADLAYKRLDVAAAKLFPDFSRVQLQIWIKSGELSLNGKSAKPKDKVVAGDVLAVEAELEVLEDLPQDIALDVVYEDEQILVINKPAGMVVHPGAGNRDNTMMNALLHYAKELASLPRAGIVHRLDRDTSGLLVIARTSAARLNLIQQLKTREMGRKYHAIVYGRLTLPGTVDQPIGRHPHHRTRMSVRRDAREAITHYRPLSQYTEHTLVELMLETGRTHQIRVHMQHLHYPLIGDGLYGGTYRKPKLGSEALSEAIKSFPRQALHASELMLVHPETSEIVTFESELPSDIKVLIDSLKAG